MPFFLSRRIPLYQHGNCKGGQDIKAVLQLIFSPVKWSLIGGSITTKEQVRECIKELSKGDPRTIILYGN